MTGRKMDGTKRRKEDMMMGRKKETRIRKKDGHKD